MAKKPAAGAPAWMATFADLMSLLLVLFVLLLTFAEMDVIRYKQIAGSVKAAFGFSQQDQLAGVIELDGSIVGKSLKAPTPDTPRVVSEIPPVETPQVESKETDTKEQKAEALEETLSSVLDNMGLQDQVGLERIDGEVVMRFPNELAFPSGSSGMTDEFAAILNRVAPVINQTEGEIKVAGHTDNVPVSASSPYISNWDLSAARATSVLHFLINQNGTDPGRMVIQGYGDSRPLATNDTPEGRATNRRVEITIEMVESNYDPDGAAAAGTGTGTDAGIPTSNGEGDVGDGEIGGNTDINDQIPERRRTFSIPSDGL
ncbi:MULTISPECIES: OmpA family protein [unclassified Thalassospira]|uniref:OmpA family protein n=1 Tax=unclassified Thalassospira TaxID=2648997 RepID=UPI0009C8DE62|nr:MULTISPECIES: OmpA family protein [unclassified Thalassospira]ONH88658.1 flagellar motor protein MotB [Thalassospira sp. MCCC 1A02803]